jgi:hypothetical protein
VWKLRVEDEEGLSISLPLSPATEPRPQPWIVHLLQVNTMNFCTFSLCPVLPSHATGGAEVFVAVPNTLDSEAVSQALNRHVASCFLTLGYLGRHLPAPLAESRTHRQTRR